MNVVAAVDAMLPAAGRAPPNRTPWSRTPTAGRRRPGAVGPQDVFTRPAAAGTVQVDLRSQVAGVLLGAAVELVGVWLGWTIARRRD